MTSKTYKLVIGILEGKKESCYEWEDAEGYEEIQVAIDEIKKLRKHK